MSQAKQTVDHNLADGNYEHEVHQGMNRPMTFQVVYEDVSGTAELKAYLSADRSGPFKEIPDAAKTLAVGDNNEYLQLSDIGFAFIKFTIEGSAGVVKTVQLIK